VFFYRKEFILVYLSFPHFPLSLDHFGLIEIGTAVLVIGPFSIRLDVVLPRYLLEQVHRETSQARIRNLARCNGSAGRWRRLVAPPLPLSRFFLLNFPIPLVLFLSPSSFTRQLVSALLLSPPRSPSLSHVVHPNPLQSVSFLPFIPFFLHGPPLSRARSYAGLTYLFFSLYIRVNFYIQELTPSQLRIISSLSSVQQTLSTPRMPYHPSPDVRSLLL
jgi:hypothetical protein